MILHFTLSARKLDFFAEQVLKRSVNGLDDATVHLNSKSEINTRNRASSFSTNSLGRPRVKFSNEHHPHRHSNVEQISRPLINDDTTNKKTYRIPLQPVYNKNFDKNSNLFVDYSPRKAQKSSVSSVSSFPAVSPHRFKKLDTNNADYSFNHEQYEYITTNLIRHPDGFGFRIVGGQEERIPIVIEEIVLGGAADVNGALKVGDEIIEINGYTVIGVAKHSQVVHLLNTTGRANGHVKLVVRRKITGNFSDLNSFSNSSFLLIKLNIAEPVTPKFNSNRFAVSPGSKPTDLKYPYDVTIIRGENEGFGFVILSSVRRKGSVIGKFKKSQCFLLGFSYGFVQEN